MNFGHNPVLLAVTILAALLASIWAYRRTIPDVGTMKAPLGAIRFTVLGIILLLLFRPSIRRAEEIEHPPVLAVLIDESESLAVTAQQSESDSLETIRSLLAAANLDEAPGVVRFYGFGGEVRALPADGFTDSLEFDQQRTNMAAALDFVRADLQQQNLKAVLLVSDGQNNSGRNPLFASERFPVPVYTVVLGDTTVKRDILVQSVVANEIGYAGSEIPVRVTVRSDGYDEATLSISIAVDGTVADRQVVRLNRNNNEGVADLRFTPEAAGLKRVRIAVTQLEGESTYRNNTDFVSVRVLDSRKRILLLSSGPGPDVSALSQILDADTNLDVKMVVQKSRGQYYETVNPDSVATYDLILLAGFPGAAADVSLVDRVVTAAANGTPVLFVMQRNTDLGIVATRLQSVIPAKPEMIRPDYFDVTFSPTSAGSQHTLMEGVTLSPQDWTRLPPLSQNNSRWRITEGATILATSTVRGIDIESPLFVALRRPGFRSIAILASGFWKWHNAPEDVEDLSGTWRSIVENSVEWLTAAEDDRPVRVAPGGSTFAESDRIRFAGQVYDESNQPVPDAAVTIEVNTPDGRRIPFNMDASGNGRYSLDSAPLPAGSYTYVATAVRDGVELGRDAGSFAVGELALEFRETRANPVLMRQIAQRSGGRFLPESELDQMNNLLAANKSFTSETETILRESELWRRSAFLVLLLALLTLEWFLRKRSGLV